MLEEYDFSNGIQGKHFERYEEGTNVVVIDSDVAKFFPDHESVNQALRSLAEIIKSQKSLTCYVFWSLIFRFFQCSLYIFD